ncbi:MAG: cellulose synthase catalytic subunit [Parvibaculaceae bacterium]|nr:cellulose synthase catalytic subunit [Parvibaculaceae bacterium]
MLGVAEDGVVDGVRKGGRGEGSPRVDIIHGDAMLDVQRYPVTSQMYDRFQRRRIVRRVATISYVLVVGAYLCWRYTVINDQSLTLSLFYFLSEIFGFILGLTALFASWTYRERPLIPAPEGLSVDVVIPVYKEPIDVIRQTLIGAKGITYPHETWVLDDGRRPEIKALAAELGVHYGAREKNAHAKAGNLNFGMTQFSGDYLMVFDADHIAMPHALDVLLGQFNDPSVGLVQTPQEFYNTDAFQYVNPRKGGGRWHDQTFFYNIAEPCRDALDGATCVGTGSLYRRAALEAIGGFPTETVTEDFHTSVLFSKAGIQTAYINEPVAAGLAEESVEDFYATRHRWAHGNLHVLRHENALFSKDLTWRQRLSYLTLGTIYLEGWQQLINFLIPVVSLLFGMPPFEISIFNVLVVLLFPFLSYALMQEAGCGYARFWVNEIFSMLRWPIHIVASLGVFKVRAPWRSANKAAGGHVQWRLLAPQFFILALSLTALGVGITYIWDDFEIGPIGQAVMLVVGLPIGDMVIIDLFKPLPEGYTADLVMIAGFWVLYNSTRVLFLVRKVLRNAGETHTFFRFKLPVPFIVTAKNDATTDEHMPLHSVALSEVWMEFDAASGGGWQVGDVLSLALSLPAGHLNVRAVVDKASNGDAGGRERFEVSFLWESPQEQDRLAAALYSVDWQKEFQAHNSYFLTLWDMVAWLVGESRNERVAMRDEWAPMLIESSANDEDASNYGMLSYPLGEGGDASLIAFRPFALGQVVGGHVLGSAGPLECRLEIMGAEPLSTLAAKGVDGASLARYLVHVRMDSSGISSQAPQKHMAGWKGENQNLLPGTENPSQEDKTA